MADFIFDEFKRYKKHPIEIIIQNYKTNLRYLNELDLDEVSNISIQAQISSLESFINKLESIRENLEEENPNVGLVDWSGFFPSYPNPPITYYQPTNFPTNAYTVEFTPGESFEVDNES